MDNGASNSARRRSGRGAFQLDFNNASYRISTKIPCKLSINTSTESCSTRRIIEGFSGERALVQIFQIYA